MSIPVDTQQPEPLRLLLVEDSENDAKLLLAELGRGGFAVDHCRVDDRTGMLNALSTSEWDAIISDYSMPGFGGLEALEIYLGSSVDVPFILVSGTIGEDVAVECMRQGAHDYLMKDHLTRLPEAIRRGMREAESRCNHREAEETLQKVFDNASDGILLADSETRRFVRANRAMCQMLGHTREEILNLSVEDIYPTEDLREIVATFEHLSQGEQRSAAEIPMRCKDGSILPAELIARTIELHGRTHLLAIFRDITDRNRAAARQALHARALEVLNRTNEWRELIRDLLVEIKNSMAIEAVGIRLQHGDDFPYFETKGFPCEFVEKERYLCNQSETGECARDETGTPVLECMCGNVLQGRTDPTQPFFTEKGSFWSCNTTEMLAQTTEKDRQAHTRNQCNSSGYESVALIPLRCGDETIGLLQLNDHRTDRFNLDDIHFLEALGTSIGIGFTRFSDREEIERLARFPSENPNPVMRISDEGVIQHANSAATPLMVAMGVHVGEKVPATWLKRVQQVIAGGKVLEGEETVDGQIIAFSLTPISGHDYVNLYGRDVTEQRAIEAQLRQAKKLESIGRLAGGVAHDFNNLLMGIMNYAELCRDKIEPDHPIREWLDEITLEAARSAKLTHQLLAFARKQIIAPRVIDLNDGISSMLKMLRRLIGEDIAIDWRPGAGAWHVKIDPTQVDQILANLAVNARDAIGGTGSITIETRTATLDPSYCAEHSGSLPGDYMLLTVTDSGCGMDQETLQNIFDPFFTTKDEGDGTGLGLATVYGIVKQNDGFINVTSEPGHGTTFKLYLPRCIDAEASAEAAEASSEPTRGSETVLLVEDEKSIRITVQIFLEDLGYTVLVAENPEEALSVAAEHDGEIDLLITDVIMPGMNGRDLANRLSELRPAMEYLFISGFTADVIAQRGVLDNSVHLLSKPFGRDALARKLREVLDT